MLRYCDGRMDAIGGHCHHHATSLRATDLVADTTLPHLFEVIPSARRHEIDSTGC
jgi:hypothetical protein